LAVFFLLLGIVRRLPKCAAELTPRRLAAWTAAFGRRPNASPSCCWPTATPRSPLITLGLRMFDFGIRTTVWNPPCKVGPLFRQASRDFILHLFARNDARTGTFRTWSRISLPAECEDPRFFYPRRRRIFAINQVGKEKLPIIFCY
jgi:hypothetical protein